MDNEMCMDALKILNLKCKQLFLIDRIIGGIVLAYHKENELKLNKPLVAIKRNRIEVLVPFKNYIKHYNGMYIKHTKSMKRYNEYS